MGKDEPQLRDVERDVDGIPLDPTDEWEEYVSELNERDD